MNWNALVAIVSTLSLLLPVALIAGFRLYTNRSLLVLMMYFLLTAAYNLMHLGILPVPAGLRSLLGTMNNYLDAPLMLLFLLFFCNDKFRARAIHLTLGVLLAYELLVGATHGFHRQASVLLLGPGLGVVLLFSVIFFVRQIKRTIVLSKGLGKTILLSAVIFGYGCYALLYYFHYIERTSNVTDIFLIYYISSFITALLMSWGLMLIRRHLNELKEVQLARRELQVFFNHPAPPSRQQA